MKRIKHPKKIVLIGAGIMSATLGVLLKALLPKVQIDIYERLNKVGAESSDAWNNAGTGHAAFCELNYTPPKANGRIDISKALKIGEAFEISKQLWAYLKKEGQLKPKGGFINDIPHMSFVWGKENIKFLKKRYASMTKYALFEDMVYTEDFDQVADWIPLMMKKRNRKEEFAVTRMDIGTDVNFGAITRGMIQYLKKQDGVTLHLGQEVQDITRLKDGRWQVEVESIKNRKDSTAIADFLFIGAGGGALPLLEKTDIPEGRGYGGFPVGGQWLRCTNPKVIEQHEAKVYGKAAEGNPPMSVPHLDTRYLNGERGLLFGPYAGFSTKFLKNGSYWDLPLSIESHNIWPMLRAGASNIKLTQYLIEQVLQSKKDRFAMLKQFYPDAKLKDWEIAHAGQRVQIIKQDPKKGGVLKFGTEVVKDETGSLAVLLGASPGASTAVSIMLDVLQQCFPDKMASEKWKKQLTKMIPSYGVSLVKHKELARNIRKETSAVLKLT